MARMIAHWTVPLATAALMACSVVQEPGVLKPEFWANSPLKENSEAELGLAELGKGNYAAAETHFRKALKSNSQDTHALLGMGILYQNTGQTTKAREMYEAILAVSPATSERFVVWNANETKPIAEIAGANLALIKNGGNAAAPASVVPVDRGTVVVTPVAATTTGRSSPTEAAASSEGFIYSEPVANVVDRFKALARLRDEGLVTPEEYATRRQANLGALLPLTSPPPAAGLDRPVPSAERIAGRLRAIGRALEMRAITVGQHAAERTMILDALMPAAPVTVANPAPPPQGLMAAADWVRRLEQFQKERLISADEYAKERAAVESALQPEPARPAVAEAGEAAAPAPVSGKPKPLTGGSPEGPAQVSKAVAPNAGAAIHLASYRSREAAEKGWTELERVHRDVLGSLSYGISGIDLGPGKGMFYRLKAGPLEKGTAEDMCRKLKQRRQYCEPTFMDAG